MTPPSSLRQSVLALFDKCSYAGKLAVEQGQGDEDSVPSQATIRGTLFHEMAIVAEHEAWNRDESGPISGDVARELMQDVIRANPHLPVSTEEMEALRLMAWNWGESFYIPERSRVLLAEQRLTMNIGFPVHGAPDLVEWEEPGVLRITDYKTSLAIPSQEEYEHKFQPAFYAMLVAHGHYEAGGLKVLEQTPKLIRTQEVYPRYRDGDGELKTRTREFTMEQLADFMVGVESITSRIAAAYAEDRFPAVPGKHCGFCPAANKCPIKDSPYTLRPVNDAEAELLARKWFRLDEEKKQVFYALRDYAKEHGPISLNQEQMLGFKLVEQQGRTSTRFGLLNKEESNG